MKIPLSSKSSLLTYPNHLNKAIRICFYALFFFTPLVMTSFTSELFEFNKMMLIYTTTTIIAFFWLLKMILFNKIIIKKTFFAIPILLFFLSQFLATIFSIDIHTSFFGYYGRFNGGLLSIICYLILFYAFVSNFGKEDVQKLLKVSLASSLVVIIWGLPGKFNRDLSCLLFTGQFNNGCWTDQFKPAERLFSTLGQPNWLGAYLAINFFLGFYFFLKKSMRITGENDNQKKDDKTVIYSGFYLLLNFTTILFTRSRSALLAVIFGLLAFGLFFFKIKSTLQKISFYSLAGLMFSLLAAILIFKTGVSKFDRFITLQNYFGQKIQPSKNIETSGKNIPLVSESGDIRKIVWKGAIDLGLRYPLLGTGVETFAYSYYFVRPKEHNLTSEWDYLYNKAHNEFLNYLATTGFAGLGGYLTLIFATVFFALASLIKVDKNLTFQKSAGQQLFIICLLLAYLTILITNFFGFSTSTINLFFYLIPGFLLVFLSIDKQKQNLQNTVILGKRQSIFMLILFIFTIDVFGYFFRYYLADVAYAQGDNLSKIGRYQESYQYLLQANKLRKDHVYEDKQSYIAANLAFAAYYQKKKEEAKNLILVSKILNKKSLSASPKNVLYWKTAAKNHFLFYQITSEKNDILEGISALLQAKKLAPTDPKIPYSLAIYYSLLADISKDQLEKSKVEELSLKYINLTINLKEDYRDGYFLKAQFLKKLNRRQEAKEVLEFILKKINPNDEEVKKEVDML